jgi:acetyl esterase/lipase
MRHALAAGAVLVVTLSFAGARGQPESPRPSRTFVYRQVGGDSLRAYVFFPPGHRRADRAPAILLFHGGGWSAGSPEWTFPAAQRFADSGLVAIAIEYRLSVGKVTPLEALDDACAAFAWARGRAAELGLSGRIAGYGVSAGGHLAAGTATIGCRDRVAGPDALLLWSPALDLTGDQWFANKLQGRATAAEMSPARHVRASTPPTCVVHGEQDRLTPLAGVRMYAAALTKLGRTCDLHVYPGLGHLLTRNLANQESDFDPDPKARADGIAQHHRFLRKLGFVGVARPSTAPVPR